LILKASGSFFCSIVVPPYLNIFIVIIITCIKSKSDAENYQIIPVSYMIKLKKPYATGFPVHKALILLYSVTPTLHRGFNAYPGQASS
jgi:hypothetical protein